MNRLLAVAALVSAFAVSAAQIPAAYANEGDLSTSLTVPYRDLDLNTKAGADALLHRIKSAARFTCGGAPDLRDLQQRETYDACVRKAAGDAIQTVHSPLVNAAAGDLG